MKKFIIASLSTLASIGFTTTFAALPATIINTTSATIDIQYTVCSQENGKICTLVKGHKLGSLGSGNNRLNIVGTLQPKSDGLIIQNAVAINNQGNPIAKLNQPCSLPSSSDVLVLEAGNNSDIACRYTR